ncbi:MAG: hypothetical protein MUC88_04625 [Planctomycetes bacterium]|nr:hypothetical protein [Planctomycetota bacterium]
MLDIEKQIDYRRRGVAEDREIVDIVRQCLRNLAQQGIVARRGVILGSYASGHPNQWRGIDLVVVSAASDGTFSRDAINSLWRVAAPTDGRIEPIPCGERQWVEDEVTPILKIARGEGVPVLPDGDSSGERARTC